MVKYQKKGDEQDALPPLHLPPPPRKVEPSAILSEWNHYIESRVASSIKEEALTRETAENYKRYARLWWEKVVQPHETLLSIPENTLLARTDAYFKELAKKNPNTCRSIRSLIVGSFLPWCIKEELSPISEKSLLCLSPLAWHRYCSPVVEKFLDDSPSRLSSLSVTPEEASTLFRALHYWIATRHLGYEGTKIKVDARPLLQSELDFWCSKPSLRSPSSWILSNQSSLPLFIASRRPPFPHHAATELFSTFITWGEISFTLLRERASEKLTFLPPESHPLRAYAPGLPPPPLLDTLTERRGKFSRYLQKSLPLRDMLIDHLIQNRNLSLSDITLLHSPPTVDGGVQSVLEQYSSARNDGLIELHLNPQSATIPFFVSADGGGVVVTEDPVAIKKTISPEAMLKEALNLITHLIRAELQPFEVLRTMTFAALRELPLSDTRSRKLIDSYARHLQVSALRFFSISQEGPGWAFPAVDGDSLTADE